MSITFPSMVPTDRQIGPGEWPVEVSRSINGVAYRRLTGSLPHSIPLDLEFFATTSQAKQCFDAYHMARGEALPVDLPAEFFDAGEEFQLPAGYVWYFREQPTTSPAFPGWVRLNMNFSGEPR